MFGGNLLLLFESLPMLSSYSHSTIRVLKPSLSQRHQKQINAMTGQNVLNYQHCECLPNLNCLRLYLNKLKNYYIYVIERMIQKPMTKLFCLNSNPKVPHFELVIVVVQVLMIESYSTVGMDD